jgi:membrane protease YdiL (CAAX protease family)
MTNETAPNSLPTQRGAVIRWWDLFTVLLAGSFAGGVAVVIVLIVNATLSHGAGLASINPDKIFSSSPADFAFNQYILAAMELPFIAIFWLVAKRRMLTPFRSYFPAISTRSLLLAALSGLAVAALFEFANEMLTRASIVTFHLSDFDRAIIPHNPVQAAAIVGTVVLLAPFAEECFYRGMVLDWLQCKLGRWLAVLVSAALFAAVHGYMGMHPGLEGWIDTAEIFVGAIVMAIWVLQTGSLWASLAVHAAYNGMTVVIAVWLT